MIEQDVRGTLHPMHAAKSARIVITKQKPGIKRYIDMIMFARLFLVVNQTKGARHAQMDQKTAAIKINQQILSATPGR
jgi:hypothetical protein